MKEIALTQNKIALVDDEDYEYLSQWKWHAIKHKLTYYVVRCVTVPKEERKRKYEQKRIWMHKEVLKTSKYVDHADLNGLNNQKSNLRVATNQENSFNRQKFRGSSKYKGVFRHRNKWTARIGFNGKDIYLGIFKTEEEAAKAYNKKAEGLFKEFARLNEIDYN